MDFQIWDVREARQNEHIKWSHLYKILEKQKLAYSDRRCGVFLRRALGVGGDVGKSS